MTKLFAGLMAWGLTHRGVRDQEPTNPVTVWIPVLWGLAALLAARPIAYVAARTSSPGALRQSLTRRAAPRWRAAPSPPAWR